MKKRILSACLFALTLFFTLSAALAEDTAVTVSFVKDAVTLSVGTSATVTATAAPYAAAKEGVTYRISDEAVATVTEKGRVTGVAAGECVLTAVSVADPSVSASVPITVIVPVARLTVTAESNAVFIGRTQQLHVTCTPENATDQTVTYESSRETVAAVTGDGRVVGIKRGSATITVRSADGNAKATFKADVRQAPETVDVSP